MPVHEAPAEYLESSSPEHSLLPELPPLLLAPPGPAALAQVQHHRPPAGRNHIPPPRQQQQLAVLLPQPGHNNRRLIARNNSFDRDVDIVEETQHFPAFVHLLPVVLPSQVPEPTLDELLRRVTQRTDLENVETVRLRVISYTVSLSQLSLFLPRLQQLDLSGSVLSSLRDLGYGLLQLTHLNISNCGLNSFDGTSGLPAIRVLIADGNMIQRVGPLAELTQLQRLSARNNRISELGLLSFLGMCPGLLEVELRGNPVCRLPLYCATLRRSVPTLEVLDGQPLRMENAHIASASGDEDEQYSTSTSLSSSDLSSDADALASAREQRPATAPQHNNNNNNNSGFPETLRPASAVNAVSVESNRRRQYSMPTTPVVGSVLGLVRQRRRRSGHAWVSSSSSSSAGSGTSYCSAGSTRAPSINSSTSSLDGGSHYIFNARSTLE